MTTSEHRAKIIAESFKTDLEKAQGPCWEGYEQVGMKDKGGKQVPNCVPLKKSEEEEEEETTITKAQAMDILGLK